MIYYIHFEITGDHCNLFGSQQCDLFPNHTIFCSKSHHFPGKWESNIKTKQPIRFKDLFKVTNRIAGKNTSGLHTQWDVKAFLVSLFYKLATGSILYWYWLKTLYLMYCLDHVILFCYCSNFSLVLKFSNQYNFYFPLSQIMVTSLRQRKIKLKLVWKFSSQRKNLNHIILHNF